MGDRHRTPTERRVKARCIRALCQTGDRPLNMTEACDKHKISRPHGYAILKELQDWEKAHTFQDEIAEIAAQLDKHCPSCRGLDFWAMPNAKWFLASGELTMAYIKGEFDDLGKLQTTDPLLE